MPRKRVKALPEGIYERRHASGNTTYAIRFAGPDGGTMREAGGRSIADAVALRRRRMNEVADGRFVAASIRTLAQYAATWPERRAREGVRTAVREGRILDDHVLPHLGHMELADVRPRHIADWVRALVAAKKLSPKSIRNTVGVLTTMFARATFDELMTSNPAKGLPRGIVPENKRVRQVAAFTLEECEHFLHDARVPWDRRVLYAIAAFTGARLGEVCGMRWSDLDEAAQPLRRWVLTTQWDRQPLKTGNARDVPIHATLWNILISWRAAGWAKLVCRAPGPDDFVVPREDGTMLSTAAGSKSVQRHAKLVGIETRSPRGVRDAHSFRRSFVTFARSAGAPAHVVERITHHAKGEQIDRYTYFGWDVLCSAVSLLRLDGKELLEAQAKAWAEASSAALHAEELERRRARAAARRLVKVAKCPTSQRFLVESRGIEPLTFSMPSRRSPN